MWSSKQSVDLRGEFSKVIANEQSHNFHSFTLSDAFVTRSNAGVIRGMHFQTGISAGQRLVHVLEGEIEDVLLDLRRESSTYLQCNALILKAGGLDTILVPGEVAHGFAALTPTKILYLADKVHDTLRDTGFNPLTIKHNWALKNPVVSERDLSLPEFEGNKF